MELSVVIPVLNEAATVRELCARLRMAIEPITTDYEIVFVGGGSMDGTEDAILKQRADDARVKLLWLSRNFGHQEALTAGMDYAGGDAVIMMDGDLQHPPEVLPRLITEWRRGYEVVRSLRLSTAEVSRFKRVSSRAFYGLINRISDLDMADGSADFRLLDRVAVNALRSMPERSRFLRGMVRWIGFSQAVVPYHADARKTGTTKYPVQRLVTFALRATLSFSAAPLYLVAVFGWIFASLGFLYAMFAIAMKLFNDVPIIGWASVLASLLFMGGVQLIAIGVAGAYIAKIFEETKARPVYLVRHAYGFANPTTTAEER